MIKTWIKAIIYAVIAVSLATSLTVGALQSKRVKELKTHVTEQAMVIDSLLTIRRNYINVDLNVTDKSTSKLYGTYNKGNITFPQVRTYRLEIDSVGVKIK